MKHKIMSCQGVLYVLVESGPDMQGVHVIASSRDRNSALEKVPNSANVLIKKGTCPIASGNWYTLLTINL